MVRKFLISVMLCFFLNHGSSAIAQGPGDWYENPINPIFSPEKRAYYPKVLEIGGVYHMWFTNVLDGVYQISYTTSEDGFHWTEPVNGLVLNASHVEVDYDAAGHKDGYNYKMWYWDTEASIYTISALRFAESHDGINWDNNQTIQQNPDSPLVTGIDSDWNRGTYGPMEVIYNPSATNTGPNPFDYSYVMYYDATIRAIYYVVKTSLLQTSSNIFLCGRHSHERPELPHLHFR